MAEDLELGYRITVDAEDATRAQRETVKGFQDIDRAAQQASGGVKQVETAARASASGLGTFEQGTARGRAQLLAFARAGLQAKADIEKLGGAQKLTTAEIDRYIGAIQRAARANELLGRSNAAREADQARLLAHLRASRAGAEDFAASQGKVSAAAATTNAMLSRLTGAFAGYLSASAIVGAIRSTAQYADELKAVAARTGLTVEAVQRLGYAARTNGTTLDKLSSSLSIMQDRLGEGNERALAALTKLGLSVQQLDQMNPEQQLYAISDGLRKVGSHNEQVAVLNDLLGRGGAELLPAFANGLRQAADEGQRFGQVMSEEAVVAAEQLDTFLENWSTRVKVTMGETIQDFDSAGTAIGKWANGVVADIALSLGAIAQLAGIEPKVGVTSGYSPTPWGSGPAVGSPSNPFVTNPSLAFGFDPNTTAGMAALTAAEQEITRQVRESIRLGNERARSLEQQARLAERQAAAFKKLVEQETAALMARQFGPDWWGRSGMTGESVGGSSWDAFMKSGLLPMSYFTGADRGREAAIRDAGFEARYLLPPSTIAGLGQQIPLEDAFPPGEDFGLNWGQEFTHGLKQRFREFAADVRENPEGLIPLVLEDLFRGGPHDAVGDFAANLAQTATQIVGDLIIPGLGQVLAPLVGPLLYKPSMRANDMRDEFIAQNGGFDDLHRRAAEAGAENQFLLMLQASNPEWLQRAIEDLTDAIEESDRARREDIQTLLSETGLADPSTIAAVASRRDHLGGEAEQQALQQFLTGNLGRAASGYSAFFEAGGQVSAENAAGFGAGVGAIFGERVGMGESPLAVLESLGPIIDAASQQFIQLGVDGGAAFADIASLAAFAADEGVAPALQQVAALNDILTGLGNTALLNQESFSALADQVTDTYQSLVDQGKNGDQALRLMQPTLQTLWQLQQDFGYQVDDSTQLLLDQAAASGLVGDQFRSAEDRMVQAIDNLITRLDDLISTMLGIGPAAEEGVTDAKEWLDDLGGPITIPVHFEYPDDAPRPLDQPNGGDYPDASHAARGGYVTPGGVQYFADGGMVDGPRGTDTVKAWLTPGEFVVDKPTVDAVGGPQAVRASLAQGEGGTSVLVPVVVVQQPGESVEDALMRALPKLPGAARRNENQWASKTAAELAKYGVR
jgi:hypothetical protein